MFGMDGQLNILPIIATSDRNASRFFVLQMSDEIAVQFSRHSMFRWGIMPFQDKAILMTIGKNDVDIWDTLPTFGSLVSNSRFWKIVLG